MTRKAIELALAGDTVALRLCLDRIVPARKDRPVLFTLPEISTAADTTKGMAALLTGVAAGKITPAEAETIGRLIEGFAKVLETRDFEERINAIERRMER